MIRWFGLICLSLFAGACSSSGVGPYEALGKTVRSAVFGPEIEAPGPEPDRATLDKIRFATIAVSFQGSARTFLVPLADNDGYLTYQDTARRGLVLKGGAVAGTDGLGQDLLGVRHQVDDPFAYPRPLIEWPGQVDRSYQYRIRDGAPFSITVTCVIDIAARETIEIVERSYETARIVESCANARRRFQNVYWVVPETGFIWKSVQWLGPKLNPVTVEIIRAYQGP